jgi:hypothetical protein
VSAIISDCGQYRYQLTRPGDLMATRGRVAFIMLNPSTADAAQDDRTIRRCRAFAKTWSCNGIVVANLYAYRATDPAALWQQPDPVGPLNDHWLAHTAVFATEVVCAWGANARPDRVRQVVKSLTAAGVHLRCLGTTKDGHPRHPLYVRGDQPLIDWIPTEEK